MKTHLKEVIKGDHKNMYRGGDITCQGCKEQVDTQSHVLTCGSYEDLRITKDLSRDEDLAGLKKKDEGGLGGPWSQLSKTLLGCLVMHYKFACYSMSFKIYYLSKRMFMSYIVMVECTTKNKSTIVYFIFRIQSLTITGEYIVHN